MILVTKFAQKLQQIVTALGKYFPATSTIVLLGKTYTGNQLVQAFQAGLTALEAVANAKSAFLQACAACKVALVEVHALYVALADAMRSQLGRGNPILAEYGFRTAARSKPSPETAAAAIKLRTATRKARHTLGKNQKAKIKAEVPIQAPEPASAGNGTGGSGTPPSAGGTGPA